MKQLHSIYVYLVTLLGGPEDLLLKWEWKYTVTNVFGYVKTFFKKAF